MTKWICTICGYIHEDDHPPDECPNCGTRSLDFVELD
jgi:rubrerythrin